MIKLKKVLETALYCDDLDHCIEFYKKIFHLKVLMQTERFCAFDVSGQSVFLLFKRHASLQPHRVEGGVIPPHDGQGPVHMAFAIEMNELLDWKQHLVNNGIDLIGQVEWPLGGESIYFHDPDNHVIELATPGTWASY